MDGLWISLAEHVAPPGKIDYAFSTDVLYCVCYS